MSLREKINKETKLKAVNWNTNEDSMSHIYWTQGVQQFWLETDFDISRDLSSWNELTDKEKEVYAKVLSGLTGLDTKQGGEGMNLISYHEPRSQFQHVFAFMGGMEAVH